MLRLDLTLPTPQENLALDEALLDSAEQQDSDQETMRVWEFPRPFVVVGRSSRVEMEVNLTACAQRGIQVLRRSSGGAAVVVGPGCLMYAVVLSYRRRPELRDVGRAHKFVLNRLADALRPRVTNIYCAGTSDLVVDDPPTARKFSGNSQRAKRTHLLYHGTLLYNFNLSLVTACLKMPPRQPTYRYERPHVDFIMNLPLGRADLVGALDRAFPTTDTLIDWPGEIVNKLVNERFSRDEWNLSFG
jgi:lipoate-protein ligase A